MLNFKTHLALLIMSFLTWGAFVLIGLPDYYQTWPLYAQIVIVVAVTVMYFPLSVFIIKKIEPTNFFRNSLWLALYLTLPLFIYDVIFIMYLKGEGWGFVWKYWYLSMFYFSFWVQIPAVGWYMENRTVK